MAFDRDRSGRIITLGTVVAATEPIRQIADTTFWIRSDGAAWPPTHPAAGGGTAVDVPTPARGVAKTYTFAFNRPESSTATDFGVYVNGFNAQGAELSESNWSNNGATVTLRNAG